MILGRRVEHKLNSSWVISGYSSPKLGEEVCIVQEKKRKRTPRAKQKSKQSLFNVLVEPL
jgi:hypothetical protein